MRRIKQSPKLPADLRRVQLLRSAQRLFLRKGYQDTTTEEIAVHAGLTKGALYFHFESKEDILYAMVKSLMDKRREWIANAVRTGRRPETFFAAMVEFNTKCGIYNAHNNLDFWVSAMAIPRIRRLVNKAYRDGVEMVANAIDPSHGATLRERRHVAVFTFSLIDGLSVRRVFDRDIVNLKAQERLFCGIICTPGGKGKTQ
ncbi:MAG: TetR/AcrR family transcriptional regulator [candidate division Zixibacteria bacterium]|nr:TetR/AcrR family transcriptional regulator [candidate division Zixibacteria bacterium]